MDGERGAWKQKNSVIVIMLMSISPSAICLSLFYALKQEEKPSWKETPTEVNEIFLFWFPLMLKLLAINYNNLLSVSATKKAESRWQVNNIWQSSAFPSSLAFNMIIYSFYGAFSALCKLTFVDSWKSH